MRFAFHYAIPLLCICASLGYSQGLSVATIDDEPGAAVLPVASVPMKPDRPAKPSSAKMQRLLVWAAWPGYGMLSADKSTFARAQRTALIAERTAFLADLASTCRGLHTHRDFFERDPINTLFGRQNIAGVMASMTAWEIAYSYASVRVPRLLARTRLRPLVYPSALVVNSFVTGNRLRAAACNAKLTAQADIRPTDSCRF